jgi:hypothetical protein
VQVRVLLAGEGGAGKVLCRGRGPDRHRHVLADAVLEGGVGGEDLGRDVGGDG